MEEKKEDLKFEEAFELLRREAEIIQLGQRLSGGSDGEL